ncbi:MAG TPA: hypothetical protein VF690_19170 [Hymenobacter sp.]|jgi:hypothetical protein
MRLYFENPVGRVLEHPDGYAVMRYAAGPRDLATFQALLTHTNHLLRRHGWHQILTDERAMAPFTEEERTWFNEFWLARSASDNYELYGAVIVPQDVFTRLSLNLIMNDSRQSALTYRLFDTEAEAVAWLRRRR